MLRKYTPGISVLFCLLLCSCTAINSNNDTSSIASNSEMPTIQNETTQETEGELEQVLNGEAFELVVPCDTTVYGSGNQYGFYQVITNTDGSRNAVFIDYEAYQQVYLCADANCQHNSERCNSWFPANGEQIWPIVCDSQIYFVHNSWEAASYIEKANLDGSDRRKIYELEDGETIDSGAAYKPGWLAFMVDGIVMQQDSASHTERLVALNTETGEDINLYENTSPEFQSTSAGAVSAFFQGVTSHGLIVKTIETGETSDIQYQTVYEIPFDGSGIHDIVTFQTGELQGVPNGDSWFYLKSDESAQQLQLGAIDSKTGENQILVQNLEKTIPVTSLGDVFIRNFVDDWIIINAMTSAALDDNQNIELLYNCYAVNRQTGEIRELLLSNYYHATRVPIEIYAQFGDNLLVEANIEEVAPQNDDQVMTGLVHTIGILNKEDYLNSNADALKPIQFAF